MAFKGMNPTGALQSLNRIPAVDPNQDNTKVNRQTKGPLQSQIQRIPAARTANPRGGTR